MAKEQKYTVGELEERILLVRDEFNRKMDAVIASTNETLQNIQAEIGKFRGPAPEDIRVHALYAAVQSDPDNVIETAQEYEKFIQGQMEPATTADSNDTNAQVAPGGFLK